MSENVHRLTIIVLMLALSIITVSCKTTNDERIPGSYGYDTCLFTIPYEDGYNAYVCNIEKYDDNYFIEVGYERIMSTNEEMHSKIYVVNNEGSLVSLQEFDYFCIPEIITKDEYIYSSNNSIVCLSRKGELIRVVNLDEVGFIYAIEQLDDGFAVVTENTISLYDKEWNRLSQIIDGQLAYLDYSLPIFEDNNRFFGVLQQNGSVFVEYDFDNNSIETRFDSDDIDISINNLIGNYFFNNEGEYRIDPTNMEIRKLADWNAINTIPPSKSGGDDYYVFDDYCFAKAYNYSDGSCDVVLYKYNSTIDYSNACKIVIGGYNIKQDLLISWAAYLFNSTHDDYRIVLEDYIDEYNGSSASDQAAATAELISHFSYGNGPDIYYGNGFDYNMMSQSGMVEDLSRINHIYLSNDDITPSVLNSMKSGDKQYLFFPAYYFDGYLGLHSVFNGNTEVAFNDLQSIANNKSIYGSIYDYNIAYDILGRNMNELINLRNSESFERIIEQVVDHSTTNGISADTPTGIIEIPDMNSVANGEYLLSLMILSDIQDFERYESSAGASFDYIGYPSINGSVHLAQGVGLIAISSDSDHKEQCYEFLRILMSDEVQHISVLNNYVPVKESVLNETIYFAVHPEEINDENGYLKSWVRGRTPVSQSIANDYRRAIDSIDTVAMYDWGLYSIILEEISSYDYQNKSIHDIAISLKSRMEVYISENYG